MRHPWRVVFPKLLEKLDATNSTVARTFWGGKLKVILPEVVSTHIYRWGFFDREVCFYMIDRLKDGDTFIDIGSHFGSFSLLASSLVGKSGKVVSIDPTPSTFNLMQSNMNEFARFKNYDTRNIALFDSNGTATFYDFGVSESAYNSIVGSRNDVSMNIDKYRIEIPTQTLDTLVNDMGLSKVDFLKIDAESAELAIIRGGRNTLAKFSPLITVEIGDVGLANAPKSIEIINELNELGYRPFEFDGSKLVEHRVRDDYNKNGLACYNLLFEKR